MFSENKTSGRYPCFNKTTFKESCFGCGCEGYHVENYYSLMKVKKCLEYTKENLNTEEDKGSNFRHQSNSNYKYYRVNICTFQEENIVPYLDAGPDILLDCIDETVLNNF